MRFSNPSKRVHHFPLHFLFVLDLINFIIHNKTIQFIFLIINDYNSIAYDVLSDPKKRKAYDSTEEFDDSIPSERAAERASGSFADFAKLFEPVFERNARWSSIQPAPKLGDANSTYLFSLNFHFVWFVFGKIDF